MKEDKPANKKNKFYQHSGRNKKNYKIGDVNFLKPKGLLSTNLIDFQYLSNPFYFQIDPYSDPVSVTRNFSDELRTVIFATIIRKIHEFAKVCINPIFEMESKQNREVAYKFLDDKIKEIKNLLEQLKPQRKKRKNLALQVFEKFPNDLVYCIDRVIRPKLRKYYKPPDKRDNHTLRTRIREFCKKEMGPPHNNPPKKLYIVYNSETNIAISLLAYKFNCSPRPFITLYSKAKKNLQSK